MNILSTSNEHKHVCLPLKFQLQIWKMGKNGKVSTFSSPLNTFLHILPLPLFPCELVPYLSIMHNVFPVIYPWVNPTQAKHKQKGQLSSPLKTPFASKLLLCNDATWWSLDNFPSDILTAINSSSQNTHLVRLWKSH